MNAKLAEQAYSRMYESNYPKDDRDDALSFLSKAIGLATGWVSRRKSAG